MEHFFIKMKKMRTMVRFSYSHLDLSRNSIVLLIKCQTGNQAKIKEVEKLPAILHRNNKKKSK